jgi:hypothetical protein
VLIIRTSHAHYITKKNGFATLHFLLAAPKSSNIYFVDLIENIPPQRVTQYRLRFLFFV